MVCFCCVSKPASLCFSEAISGFISFPSGGVRVGQVVDFPLLDRVLSLTGFLALGLTVSFEVYCGLRHWFTAVNVAGIHSCEPYAAERRESATTIGAQLKVPAAARFPRSRR